MKLYVHERFIWMVLHLAVHVISLSFAFLVASRIMLRWSEVKHMFIRTEHGIKIACVFLYDSASKFLDSVKEADQRRTGAMLQQYI
jgi:hypothetical protein